MREREKERERFERDRHPYTTIETFEEHIATVIRQEAWETQVELYAAASY